LSDSFLVLRRILLPKRNRVERHCGETDVVNAQSETDDQLSPYRVLLRSIGDSLPPEPRFDLARDRLSAASETAHDGAAEAGFLLLDAGELLSAEAVFEAVRLQFPANAAGFVGLARVAMRSGSWLQALAAWDTALDRFDGGDARPFWRIGRATALLELGRWDVAEDTFEALLHVDAVEHAALLGLAQIASRRGNWTDAVARWTQLLDHRLMPAKPGWRAAQAVALGALGRIAEAEAMLAGIAQEFPSDPAGLAGLAQIRMRAEDWPASLAAWDHLSAAFPGELPLPWRTSRAEALIRLDRLVDAEAELRTLRRDHPHYVPALRLWVRVLTLTGRQTDALAALDLVPETAMDDAPLLSIQLTTLANLGQLVRARSLFREALDAPTDLPRLESLFGAIPRIFEGGQRTRMWLALLDRLRDGWLEEKAERAHRRDVLRARLLMALRDYEQLAETVTGFRQNQPPIAYQTALETALSKLQRPDFRAHTEPKIFGIGLSKTGTTSLAAALRQLGFDTIDWANPITQALISTDDFYLYDAFCDTPVSVQFERLYYLFPNAKFIYTTRPIAAWKRSIESHFKRFYDCDGFDAMKARMLVPDRFHHGTQYRETMLSLYCNHSDFVSAYTIYEHRVRQFFADKPADRFLDFSVFAGQAWRELCGFVDRAIPDTPFPWENRAPASRADRDQTESS
jgi:tetratricopeptide (TPR) repeat protein